MKTTLTVSQHYGRHRAMSESQRKGPPSNLNRQAAYASPAALASSSSKMVGTVVTKVPPYRTASGQKLPGSNFPLLGKMTAPPAARGASRPAGIKAGRGHKLRLEVSSLPLLLPCYHAIDCIE